jgi:hypothetical protein
MFGFMQADAEINTTTIRQTQTHPMYLGSNLLIEQMFSRWYVRVLVAVLSWFYITTGNTIG